MRLGTHFLGILVCTTSAWAATPPQIVTQGKGAAIACASCHGMEGAGNSAGGYPALAQLPQAYFTKQIADFKAGTRTSPVMTPIAKAMTPEDAEAAGSYYASLPRPPSPSAPVDAGMVARGEKLAINGAWDRGIPACFKCHAPGGTGVAPSFPPITGQHAGYTVSQLQAWKAGTRTNDPLQLMKTVAEKLSEDEMRAVAAYLASPGNGTASASAGGSSTPSGTQAPSNPNPAGKPANALPTTATPAPNKKPATQEKSK